MKGLLFTIALVATVLGLLAFYADFGDLRSSISGFTWALLPLVLGLTVLNYAVRYYRWEVLLRMVMGRPVPRRENFLIFVAGSGWIMTPGRAGEVAKSYFVRESFGTPMARTAPIIVCERVIDVMAMVLLASVGLVLFRPGLIGVPVVLLLAAVAAIYGLRNRRVAAWIIEVAERVPILNRSTRLIGDFHAGALTLLTPSGLSWALGLGLLAWALECVTFFTVVAGLGEPVTVAALIKAAFIFPMSTLAGTLTLLPAGLGPTDASMAGLSQGLLSLGRSDAVAAAVLTRSVILGLPVLTGLGATLLLTMRRRASQATVAGVPAPPGG